MSAMLDDLDFSHLRELQVDVFDGAAFPNLPAVFAASAFASTLELLDVRSHSYEAGLVGDARVRFTGSQLRPLSHLYRLRSISLSTHGSSATIEIDDADWEYLARAWPDLESLSIADSRESINGRLPTRPTLQALVHLARYCAKLRSAEMTVDMGPVHIDEALPVQPHLNVLKLRHATCEDVGAVAGCLAQLFPHLTAVSRLAYSGSLSPSFADNIAWIRSTDFKETLWDDLASQVAEHQSSNKNTG